MVAPAASGADAGDWLQFSGAVLTGLIAVGLWVAERWRQERARVETEREQRRDFRSVVLYAVETVGKQVNYISNGSKLFLGDYNKFQVIEPKLRPPAEATFVALVQSRVSEMTISVPSMLEFRLEHARFLHPKENEEMAAVLVAIHALNARLWELASTAGTAAIGEPLYLVADQANLLYVDLEKLEVTLRDRKGGSG